MRADLTVWRCGMESVFATAGHHFHLSLQFRSLAPRGRATSGRLAQLPLFVTLTKKGHAAHQNFAAPLLSRADGSQ